MLSTYLKNIAASLVVLAIILMPSMANAGGINFSNPDDGDTISLNFIITPDAGLGIIVRATRDHASVHGGFWVGDRTNGVLGLGVTSDYDSGDWEVNGEIGMSVVFKRHETFNSNLVPYFRLGAAYLNADNRYGLGVSHYGFAYNNGLEGEYVIDFEIGKDGTRKESMVMQSDEGMTQIDPPTLQCEDEVC